MSKAHIASDLIIKFGGYYMAGYNEVNLTSVTCRNSCVELIQSVFRSGLSPVFQAVGQCSLSSCTVCYFTAGMLLIQPRLDLLSSSLLCYCGTFGEWPTVLAV